MKKILIGRSRGTPLHWKEMEMRSDADLRKDLPRTRAVEARDCSSLRLGIFRARHILCIRLWVALGLDIEQRIRPFQAFRFRATFAHAVQPQGFMVERFAAPRLSLRLPSATDCKFRFKEQRR